MNTVQAQAFDGRKWVERRTTKKVFSIMIEYRDCSSRSKVVWWLKLLLKSTSREFILVDKIVGMFLVVLKKVQALNF